MNLEDLLKSFNITYDELLEHVTYQNCDTMMVSIEGYVFRIVENLDVEVVALYA